MVKGYRILVIGMLLVIAGIVQGANIFYRIGRWTDSYLMQGLDTNYIALPEHSWRLAVNSGIVGIHSDYMSGNRGAEVGKVVLHMKTSPGIGLGFNAGYRGFGFGYSWDLQHAYARNLNISFGSKGLGIEFMRQVSTNINGTMDFEKYPQLNGSPFSEGLFQVTTTHLTAWYALNARHYSHNAAIKQSYIQRKTAGSLLLSVSYMSSDWAVMDTLHFGGKSLIAAMILDDVSHMVTRQVSVGLGYGINYTPNHGKVLIHAAAYAQLVCYSINQIALSVPDTIPLPSNPYYNIQPHYPVHVTGTMRAAVSWEINKWVHLSAWGQFNNVRFKSRYDELVEVEMSTWNWQAHLTVGVRFGAGKERVNKAFANDPLPEKRVIEVPVRKNKMPQWITEYFYSSMMPQ